MHPLLRLGAIAKGFVASLRFGGALLVSLFASPLAAIEFDIPAGSLSEAILEFSEQSDTTVIAPARALEGLRVEALRGDLSKEEALKRLLVNSHLGYEFTANGNVRVIEKRVTEFRQPRRGPIGELHYEEEVIVSAARRRQLQHKYAGTLHAYSEADLRNLALGYDFQSLQGAVPGLQISLNEGFQEIFVRGIGTQDNSASSDQPTAVHYHNAYVPKMRGLGPVMFDIEQVEVHQGPQGTLRGRNATAGTINILPKLPDLLDPHTELRFETGNYDLTTKQLVLNYPLLRDSLGLRFAYHSRDHDDYFSNARQADDAMEPVTGAGSEDENAWRGGLLWQPHLRYALHLLLDRSSSHGSGFPGNYGGQTFSQGWRIDDLDDPWEQFFQTAGRVDTDVESAILTQTLYLDTLEAELILSQREYDSLTVNPRRPFQHGFVNPIVRHVNDISVWQYDNYNTNWISDGGRACTLELRLAAPNDEGPLFWTAGLYLFDETAAELRWDISDAPALRQDNLGGPDHTRAEALSRSLYADISVAFAPDWRALAGLRYTHERKHSQRWDARLIFDDLSDSADLDRDGNTAEILANDAALAQLVRLGTPGFAIVPARRLALVDPNAYGSARDFLDALVASYGERDNLHTLLAAEPTLGSVVTIAPEGIARSEFDDGFVNWRLGLEHDRSSTHMLYGTLSTGTRAGGINPPVYQNGQALRSTFDNESLLAAELGSKYRFHWREQPGRLDLSAFYYHYDNQIFQVGEIGDDSLDAEGSNVNADLRQSNVNIGTSRAFGLTLDSDLQLNERWVLGANLLWLETAILEGEATDGRQSPRRADLDGDGTLETVAPPRIDLRGNPLINSPRFSVNLQVGQHFRVLAGSLFDWTLSLAYKSRFYSTPFANKGYDADGNPIALRDMALCCDTQYADANGDGHTEIGDGRFFNDEVNSTLLMNLNLGLSFGRRHQHRVELFGRNLTEEAYPQKQIINPAVNIVFLNTPRVFGMSVHSRF